MTTGLDEKGKMAVILQKDVRFVCRADFEEFGHRIGLSVRLVKRELDFFAAEHPLAQLLIEHSFLPEKLKRYYRLSYDYRRTTLA